MINLTPEEYKKLQGTESAKTGSKSSAKRRARSKYRNKWVTGENGVRFQSKMEAARYSELLVLEQAGDISQLELQPRFELQPKFTYQGKTIRAITYSADFGYIENGKHVIEDVKGVETQVFKVKWKMVKYLNPDIDFRVVK